MCQTPPSKMNPNSRNLKLVCDISREDSALSSKYSRLDFEFHINQVIDA